MTEELIFRSPVTDDDFKKYYDLRWKILRKPWDQPKGSEKTESDLNAFHLLAEMGDEIVGIGCIHEENKGVGRIRFMGVDDSYQNQGIGETIVILLEQYAISQNWVNIRLLAREIAVSFYQNLGYQIVGDGKLLFGVIKHKIMNKNL